MSEMIERVAKAILKAYSEDPWEDLNKHWREVYTTEARAAIEAMRKPTEAMILNSNTHSCLSIWQSMIDEALK